MVIEFTSRLGKKYFIKSRLTKKGKTTYFLTRKKDEHCLDKLPKDYEVYEKPDMDAMYIRKVRPSLFTKAEIVIVEKELEKNKNLGAYKIDTIGNQLRIYVAEDRSNVVNSLFQKMSLSSVQMNKTRDFMTRFEEKMRIEIDIDEKTESRSFEVQRYCYRGSIDDWISLNESRDLKDLAKLYIKHLGSESYFDLM